MRVFFALPLDSDNCLKIASWRDRQFPDQGRFVPMVNFHTTLAFVGELSDARLERLCLSVEECLGKPRITTGTLELNLVGYWHKQGLFWLGPRQWPEQLTQFAKRLQSLASRVGGKRDRKPFQPHITLLRKCRIPPAKPVILPVFRVDYGEVVLFESLRGKQGIRYQPLQHWKLA